MKATLVLLALCVGVALASPVCLPNQFQYQMEQQFQPQNNNGFGGFDLTEEWYDYTNKNTRTRQIVWMNNEQYMMDFILIGATQKLYTVNATKGSGVVTCTVQKALFPPSTPCLFSNATIVAQAYVAGDVFCQVWAQQSGFGANQTLYQDVTLTAEDNVPISSREYFTGTGSSFELYANYAINLDPGAFNIPPLCPDSPTVDAVVVPEAQIRKMFKRLHDPKKI